MKKFKIKKYQPAYREQVIALYQTLKEMKKDVIFWWPGEETYTWDYCPCVFLEDKLIAKGQVLTLSKATPGEKDPVFHQIYMNIKVDPKWENTIEIKEMLYHYLYEKALKLKENLSSEYKTRLRVGNFSTEEENNDFFISKGFKPFCSLFWMERDVHLPFSNPPEVPFDIEVKRWKMETEEEEQQYMKVEHQIWPESAITQSRLREYKQRELWSAFTAFHHNEIVGSAMTWVYDKKEKIGEIEDIFVIPEWRKKGIARNLLTQALAYLQEHQLKKALLLVLTDNLSALKLYQSAGFDVVKEEKRFEIEI